MFEQSLVESTAMLRSRSRKPILTAAAIQATLAAALISIPLLHPEILPIQAPKLTLIAPPMPKPRPPEIPHVQMQEASSSNTMTAPVTEAIPIISNQYRPIVGTSLDPPSLADPSSMGMGPAMPAGITSSSGTGTGVSVRPEPPAHKGPLAISTGVMTGMLLAPIVPVYPQIAKLTHTEGTVVIEAVISTTGRIESAHAVSGPAMLQAAALDAVKTARYRPFLLNGNPTEVQTTITVNFRMGS